MGFQKRTSADPSDNERSQTDASPRAAAHASTSWKACTSAEASAYAEAGARTLTRRQFARLGALGAAALLAGGSLAGCTNAQESTSSATSSASSSASSSSAEASTEALSTTLFVFDTVVTLTAYCDQDTLDAAAERCLFFENAFSRTVEGSDVWRLNEAAGAPVEVEPETADVITRALAYSEASGGLFDITIGAVSSLWDFVSGIKPEDDAIAEAVRHVDYRCVEVDGTTVRLSDPDAKIDLGGIAKGYIADDLVRLFAEAGCSSACVNLGGNVAVLGGKPDGSPWKVGVQDPNGSANDIIAAVSCTDATVVTSGLYERQFTQDGVNYYHILDPRTGYPATTDLVSSSIITTSSTDGDAWATILFLQGHDAALATIEADERFEGLVVNAAGEITLSSGAPFELR